MLTRSLWERNRLLTHRLRSSFNGQIGGNDGEDALGITNRNGAGDHPDLTAARIKIRVRPDARVCGQWRRDPVYDSML